MAAIGCSARHFLRLCTGMTLLLMCMLNSLPAVRAVMSVRAVTDSTQLPCPLTCVKQSSFVMQHKQTKSKFLTDNERYAAF